MLFAKFPDVRMDAPGSKYGRQPAEALPGWGYHLGDPDKGDAQLNVPLRIDEADGR
jgi:hypothetical protein